MYNQYLIHYGIPGMKWGIRKKKPPKVKTMTTKDLKKKTDRLRLERDYKAMTQKKRNRAKIIGAAVLATIATTAASTIVRKFTNDGIGSLTKSKIPETLWDLPTSEFKKAVSQGRW